MIKVETLLYGLHDVPQYSTHESEVILVYRVEDWNEEAFLGLN
jgi:hypothetical protein